MHTYIIYIIYIYNIYIRSLYIYILIHKHMELGVFYIKDKCFSMGVDVDIQILYL